MGPELQHTVGAQGQALEGKYKVPRKRPFATL